MRPSLKKGMRAHTPLALGDIGEEKVFSTLHLKSGHCQIVVTGRDKKCRAFARLMSGTYRLRMIPFGLKRSRTTFQKLMSQVLVRYRNLLCIVYMDDVIVYSKNHKDHERHLALPVKELRRHELTCIVEICRVGKTSLEYQDSSSWTWEIRPIRYASTCC